MPPKFIPKHLRGAKKTSSDLATKEEEKPDDVGESTPASLGEDSPAVGGAGASDGASTLTGDGAASVSDGLSVAAVGGAGAAVGGAGAPSLPPADDYLTEALPGEEHHHRLMSEAMAKINITTSTYAHKIHPNTRDVKVSNLTIILKGKELLVDAELILSYGCRCESCCHIALPIMQHTTSRCKLLSLLCGTISCA